MFAALLQDGTAELQGLVLVQLTLHPDHVETVKNSCSIIRFLRKFKNVCKIFVFLFQTRFLVKKNAKILEEGRGLPRLGWHLDKTEDDETTTYNKKILPNNQHVFRGIFLDQV